MGLDQYAFAVKGGEKVEIAYWRKHADLEGYMSELWRSRGNNGEFNCEELELDTEDLMDLRDSHRNLETANGFLSDFFGTITSHPGSAFGYRLKNKNFLVLATSPFAYTT